MQLCILGSLSKMLAKVHQQEKRHNVVLKGQVSDNDEVMMAIPRRSQIIKSIFLLTSSTGRALVAYHHGTTYNFAKKTGSNTYLLDSRRIKRERKQRFPGLKPNIVSWALIALGGRWKLENPSKIQGYNSFLMEKLSNSRNDVDLSRTIVRVLKHHGNRGWNRRGLGQ